MIIEKGGKKYEIVIGVEIHTQLSTKSKLFSPAKNSFADQQNTNVDNLDLGIPGMLPVLNKEVGRLAAMVGFGVGGDVQMVSRFDRKHYFYPDLPQGYQISQFYHPIVFGGCVDIWDNDGNVKKISIERIHIEQDAGRLIHDKSLSETFIDYNRAGVPLLEIVSNPDMRSPEEVVCFLKEIRMVLRSTGASDADMEKGSFRCDANVSVREVGTKKLGTRCEIKNLNSFRFVSKAIEYEANRQVDVICDGEIICQQTRLFNVETGKTFAMRDKETSNDYRYFPDPDLLELVFSEDELFEIKKNMPTMPCVIRENYVSTLELNRRDATNLMSEGKYMEFFEYLIKKHEPKFALGWVMNELVGLLKKLKQDINNCLLTKEDLRILLDLIKDGLISGKIGKEILFFMLESGKSAKDIIEEKNLQQVNDSNELEKFVLDIITNNPKEVSQYKVGNSRVMSFFVGQVMKVTKGQANPVKVNELLKKHLS
ncbi:MAG: Asp-tRNA(Asn)/Glu-tRNA(Gln) amidotransferase subunit GatB [Alphaproteobacteria bacterium]|nr:Asp-tRNA(Asn)/Glu-tRNA(Gln) amidotransferase subunit GatB [Rickettsiales bacterium]